MTRLVVLDTETTGLEPEQGHRVIEIGGVEMVDRKLTGRHFHEYLNPEREIDDAAYEVHGLSAEFLRDKPIFADVGPKLLEFIGGAELVIHNAPFDVSFIDYELSLLERKTALANHCQITDSLALARHKHPGQKNGLDALCRRYDVDNSARELHGALLDAEILADVYLAMTGGQTFLFGEEEASADAADIGDLVRLQSDRPPLIVVRAEAEAIRAHEAYLDRLDEEASDGAVWRRMGSV